MAVTVEKISRLSEEFIHVKITTDTDISLDAVSFAVITGTEPVDGDWFDGVIVGTGARALIGPGSVRGELPTGRLGVWVKIHDVPEVPVKLAGYIQVF